MLGKFRIQEGSGEDFLPECMCMCVCMSVCVCVCVCVSCPRKCMCVCVCPVASVLSSFATPWTAAHQAPLSTEFPREEYHSGLPFPTSGDLPDPGIEALSLALQADSLPLKPSGNVQKHPKQKTYIFLHTVKPKEEIKTKT